MKLDDNAVVNAVAKLAKVSDLIEQWHKEAFDRYAWEVEYQQRDGDMRVLIKAMLRKVNNGELLHESRVSSHWRYNAFHWIAPTATAYRAGPNRRLSG